MVAGEAAQAAELVAGILRLAEDGSGTAAMSALAEKYRDRPTVLGAAVVLLGGELAALKPGSGRGDALTRFDRTVLKLGR